jgi:hypothetical protein
MLFVERHEFGLNALLGPAPIRQKCLLHGFGHGESIVTPGWELQHYQAVARCLEFFGVFGVGLRPSNCFRFGGAGNKDERQGVVLDLKGSHSANSGMAGSVPHGIKMPVDTGFVELRL